MADPAIAKYLSDNVGGVLAEAMAELAVAQPSDGVDFLAQWLKVNRGGVAGWRAAGERLSGRPPASQWQPLAAGGTGRAGGQPEGPVWRTGGAGGRAFAGGRTAGRRPGDMWVVGRRRGGGRAGLTDGRADGRMGGRAGGGALG